MMKFNVPKEIKNISEKLAGAGFEAYFVGGCVRDLMLKREPKDWDVTTNAKPEEIQGIFPESVYENKFGTVGVKISGSLQATGTPAEGPGADPATDIVEVTTYRIEGKYTDKRHPDDIKSAKTIKEDLSRRDFTVNALAMDLAGKIIDPYGGVKDLKAKLVRTVGEPRARFEEDALRLLRAVRFACELGFEIEVGTGEAIRHHAGLLEAVAKERIRDEFQKMIMTPRAAEGVILLEDYGLLQYVMPELREGIGTMSGL